MTIKITGMDAISKKLNSIATTEPPLDAIGAYAVQEIIARTHRGVDMHRKSFKPYAETTKESRTKYGAQVSRVDLTMTGNMLASMTHNVKGNTVTILFRASDENAKAHGHYFGTKRLPQRKFFGINTKMKKAIVNIIENRVARGYR